jgi:hypothetical protein
VPCSCFADRSSSAPGTWLVKAGKGEGAALAAVTLICGFATWLPVCGIRVRRNSKARRGRSALAPQMQSLVMVAFVGAIVACVAYARAIALQLRAQHAPYVAEGAAVICALAAAFVAFAAVDSHLFLALKAPRKLSCKQTAMQLFIPVCRLRRTANVVSHFFSRPIRIRSTRVS